MISECKTDEREGSHFPEYFNDIFVVNCLQSKKKRQSILMQIVWFQKFFIIPPRKGSDLPQGGGLSAKFFSGGGAHHRDIFPVGSRGAYESKKDKTPKFTTTIDVKDMKHERLITYLKLM